VSKEQREIYKEQADPENENRNYMQANSTLYQILSIQYPLKSNTLHITKMASPGPEQSSTDIQTLTKSWLGYVRGERKAAGMKQYLPYSAHCFCGRSRTSYPHWPPTTHGEAMAQPRCLTGNSYQHRLHLADCWHRTLCMEQARSRDDTAETKALISLVGKVCGEAAKKSLRRTGEQTRQKIDCGEVCEPVLREKSCFCLCCCPAHREECPVHRCD